MIICFALALAAAPGPTLTRDAYGVPHITAETDAEAYFEAGYAVAQDRLWQMEKSRRLTEGRMAEVFGPDYVAADKQVLQTFYTPSELDQQLHSMPKQTQTAYEDYARGVNAWIGEAEKSGKLPAEYAKYGFEPEKWTTTDSVAIGVWALQEFGRGGAGQVRDLAVLKYLQLRPNLKGHALDVWEDFLWENDPSATCTVSASDDALASKHPDFHLPDRATTEAVIKTLPDVSIFDLLPALRLAMRTDAQEVAEANSVVNHWGSYCLVVGPQRSASGYPLLLSGPQMGFDDPSIIHEISMDAPGLQVSGIDIPGAPGVVIGCTPSFAWGLTSGVAATDDVFYSKTDGPDSYLFSGRKLPIVEIKRTLKVRGQPDQTVIQRRTMFGPVVAQSQTAGVVFSVRRSYWMREMWTADALLTLYTATNPDEIEGAMEKSTMNFNFFYATTGGATGWRYLGDVPIRSAGTDPRLPTPGEPKDDWKGMIPQAQMPHVENPKSGLIANWNNKPVSWWPNLDTPVWGRIFRNSALLSFVTGSKLNSNDLEHAAWGVARTSETWPYFEDLARGAATDSLGKKQDEAAARMLLSFDGQMADGSQGATIYLAWLSAMKAQVFLGAVGNFSSPDLFETAVQPTLLWNALHGKTHYDYLASRKPAEVALAAFQAAVEKLKATDGDDPLTWGYKADGISVPGQPDIPYSNRGSYIQSILLGPHVVGKNVVEPGEAEDGDHAYDQVWLSRSWMFKPMWTAFLPRPPAPREELRP